MDGTFAGQPTDLWLALEPEVVRQSQGADHPVFGYYAAVARLSPGSSHRAAADELNSRFADLAARALRAGANPQWIVHPRITRNPQADDQVLGQVRLFLAASVLVAVVAAVNIGLFMLARAPGRRREINLRFALGASRRRIVRQLITESGVLVTAAALLGLAASLGLSAVLQDLAFLEGAGWREVSPLDWRVLVLMVCGVAVLTAMAALGPAFGLRQSGIAHAMRQVSARAGGAQRASGIAQIALAGLLGGAALGFGWQLVDLARADFGFEPEGVVVVTAKFEQSVVFGGSWEELVAARASRRELIAALPAVDAVAFGVPAPTVPGFSMSLNASSPDDPDTPISVSAVSIDAEFPRILGMRLLTGAMPQAEDPLGVLINERLAREVWGHLDVIGEPVPLTAPMPSGVEGTPTVIGVLADVAYSHPHAPIESMVFSPATFFSRMESIVLQTQASPTEIRASIQALIDQGLIDFEIDAVVRLRDSWHELLAADRARAQLSIIAALVAVFLAAFGFYGTQRYLVAAGRREYAIQAALGAGPKAIGRMVLMRGLALGLPGLVLGALLAFLGIVWLQDGFIDQTVSPWVISLLVAIGTAVLILLASLGPARQARRMTPAEVLRED
ncbi:MAG: FtsX-like permease family protein, partial [Wenzhouxiangella sp.]|nr:FtsX-like permease family protein [Wenzhouxiangella sp.]